MPVRHYIAYVDEAGDEGFGKLREGVASAQSKWFSIGACVLDLEHDKLLPTWRDGVVDRFQNRQVRDLHFRDLKHDQKVFACSELAKRPLGACVVSSNKVTLLTHPKREIFKQKQYLYNYLTRYLLERLTHACKKKAWIQHQAEARLRVIFSRRKGTDYEVMRDYLCLMRDGKEKFQPVRSIDWNVLRPDDIAVENHKVRVGLQISDLYTSAVWKALEPNGYGHSEPRYAQELANQFLRSQGQILNCGITVIPPVSKSPLGAQQREFLEWIISHKRKAPAV
jgi:hypothetical protein